MSVEAELPRYKCHKEVHAVKIAAIKILEDGRAKIAPDDKRFAVFETTTEAGKRFKETKFNSDDPGYFVVYEDGYVSWSPTKAFEEGYTLIGGGK